MMFIAIYFLYPQNNKEYYCHFLRVQHNLITLFSHLYFKIILRLVELRDDFHLTILPDENISSIFVFSNTKIIIVKLCHIKLLNKC